MASDETESKKGAREPLPESVVRALAEARASATAGAGRSKWTSGTPSGRWLALIPVTAALVMALLVMPRSAAPTEIPLPQIDPAALAAVTKDDQSRAVAALSNRLPGVVLEVGTAIRGINRLQARGASPDDASGARATLDHAMLGLASAEPAKATDYLRTLRAVQLEGFLAEVARFEATGQSSTELDELGGGFIGRMAAAGWVKSGRVLLDEPQRRAAFKLVWTAVVVGDRATALALTIDEQRALYTLYLRYPHAPETQRTSLDALRRGATNEAECKHAAGSEKIAAELWRAEKIKKLGELDPSYPTSYALGVAHYRAGNYESSAEAFRTWIARHPEGPLALRARNHLKAALIATGPS